MPVDKILTWDDYADEVRPHFNLPRSALSSYRAYLSFLYELNHGEPTPPVPETLEPTDVFVNVGRWLWQCRSCGGAVPVKRGEPVICNECGTGGWRRPAFPSNYLEIEEELLNQPGRRLFSPLRNWLPGWTLEDLQDRTQRANAAIAAGNPFPRSLSIGATRAWAGGEVLTASNKNTFESAVMEDLAGRNGRVDFEDALRVKDGANPTTQPYLDLDESFIGLPLRTSDPASSEGRLTYRSDLNEFRANKGSGWYSLSQYTDFLSSGQDMTPGTEITVNLPTGDNFGSYRWMQVYWVRLTTASRALYWFL